MRDFTDAATKAEQAFQGALNLSDVSTRGMDMLTSKNDAAIRAKMDEAAGDAAYHREGTHKVTGNYTFDSVYSVLQRNFGGLGEGIQKFLDRDEYVPLGESGGGYQGKKGSFFLDTLVEPVIGTSSNYQIGEVSTARPIAVVDENGKAVKVLRIPVSHRVMHENFFTGKKSITLAEYEEFKDYVEAPPRMGGRGEDVGEYITADQLENEFEFENAVAMARSQSTLGQKYVEALAAMRVNQRIMGAKLEGEAAAGLGVFGTMVNENVRPFSTSVQHILESAQHTARQVLPMSVRGFANLLDPDYAAAIDRVSEEALGKDWAKNYQELVQYEGPKFIEGLGSAGGQLAMQMFVSGTLGPLGLGLVGFVGTAMGYVQGTVQKDRYEYYTGKGMDEEEARRRSLSDGAFAGLMTGVSESIVGGLGKFANKPAFMRNLTSVVEDFSVGAFAMGGLREGAQETIEESLQRAYFKNVRGDSELANQDLFSPEFLEELKTVFAISFVTGGAGGTVSNLQLAMSLAPAEVGTTVKVGNEFINVTEENVKSVNRRLRIEFRNQMRMHDDEPLGGAVSSLMIRGIHNLNIMRSKAKFEKVLRAAGAPEAYIQKALTSIASNKDQTRSLRAIFGPQTERMTLNLINTTEKTTGKGKNPGAFAGAFKIEIAKEMPQLAEFLATLDSNNIAAAKKKAQLFTLGKNQELIRFLDSLSEKDLGELRKISAESTARVESEVEGALIGGLTPEAAPTYIEEVTTDGVTTDDVIQRVADDVVVAAKADGASDEEANAIADSMMEKMLYPDPDNPMTGPEKKLLDRVTKGNSQVLLDALEARGEEAISAKEGEEADVPDTTDDAPRFSRGTPEGVADEVADSTEAGEVAEAGRGFEASLQENLRKQAKNENLDLVVLGPDEMSDSQKTTQQGYAERGLRVVFFYTKEGDTRKSVPGDVAATISSDTGVIYINADASLDRTVFDSLMGHEVFHGVMRQDRRAAVDFLMNAMEQDPDGFREAFAIARRAEADPVTGERGTLTTITEVEQALAGAFELALNGNEEQKARAKRILEETGAYYIQRMATANPDLARGVITSLAKDSRNIPVIRRMKNTLRSLIDFTPEDADWETRERWDALHEMMAGHSQRVEDGSFVEISQTFGKLNSEFNPETAVEPDETGTPAALFARTPVEMTDEIKAGIARRRAVYGTETTSELAENGVSATPSDLYRQFFGRTGTYRPQRQGVKARLAMGSMAGSESDLIADAIRSPFSDDATLKARNLSARLDKAITNRVRALDVGTLTQPMFSRVDVDSQRPSISASLTVDAIGERSGSMRPPIAGFLDDDIDDPKHALNPVVNQRRKKDPRVAQLKRDGLASGLPIAGMGAIMGQRLVDDYFGLDGSNLESPVRVLSAMDLNDPNLDLTVLKDNMRNTMFYMLEDQVEMADELYRFGLATKDEASMMVLNAKAATLEAGLQTDQLVDDLIAGNIDRFAFMLEMKRGITPILSTNFGVTYYTKTLMERIAESEFISDVSKATAKSLLNSAGSMSENSVVHFNPTGVLANTMDAVGTHSSFSTASGMDLMSIDMDRSERKTAGLESAVATILHEYTHAVSQNTISFTLAEAVPTHPAWVTPKENTNLYSLVNIDPKAAGMMDESNHLGAELSIILDSLPTLAALATSNKETLKLSGNKEMLAVEGPVSRLQPAQRAQLAKMRYGSTAYVANDFMVAHFVSLLTDYKALTKSIKDPDYRNALTDLHKLAESVMKSNPGNLRIAAVEFFQDAANAGLLNNFGAIMDHRMAYAQGMLTGEYGMSSMLEYMAEYVANPAFRTLLDSNINQVMSKYGVELGDIKISGAKFDMFQMRDALGMLLPATPIMPHPDSSKSMARMANITTNMMSHNMRQDLFFSRRLTGESKPDAMQEGEQAQFFGKLPYAQRRKFEQQAAKILSEEWDTIGKDLSVNLLGSVDVVRGWWMGDFNPGLQVFIDKADEKQTDAAAATLAYVLDQHGVGVVESIKVVDEGQAPNGIVIKGPASKRDFDRITKVMQDVFTEAGYAEMTSFSFPFDVARKQIGLAYHGSTESITEENLNEIERRLGEKYEVVGADIPNRFISKSKHASGPESVAGRNADSLRRRIRQARNEFLTERGYKGELFFSRAQVEVGGVRFARADINSEAGKLWSIGVEPDGSKPGNPFRRKALTLARMNAYADRSMEKEDFGKNTVIETVDTDYDSGVVTFYHGTQSKHGLEGGDFKKDKFGSFTGARDAKAGIFLTTDKNVAKGYAKETEGAVAVNVEQYQADMNETPAETADKVAAYHESVIDMIEKAKEQADAELEVLGLNTSEFKRALMLDPSFYAQYRRSEIIGDTDFGDLFSFQPLDYKDIPKKYRDMNEKYRLVLANGIGRQFKFDIRRQLPREPVVTSEMLQRSTVGEMVATAATLGDFYNDDTTNNTREKNADATRVAERLKQVADPSTVLDSDMLDLKDLLSQVVSESASPRKQAKGMRDIVRNLRQYHQRFRYLAGQDYENMLEEIALDPDFGLIEEPSRTPFLDHLKQLNQNDPEQAKIVLENMHRRRPTTREFSTIDELIADIESLSENLKPSRVVPIVGDVAIDTLEFELDQTDQYKSGHMKHLYEVNMLSEAFTAEMPVYTSGAQILRAAMTQYGTINVEEGIAVLEKAAEVDRERDLYDVPIDKDEELFLNKAIQKQNTLTADIERVDRAIRKLGKVHSIVKAHVRGEMFVHQTSDYDADVFQDIINDAQDDGYAGVIFKDVSDGMGANSGQQSQVVVVFDPKDVLIQDESHAGNPVLFSRFGDGVLDAAVPKVNSIAKSVGEVFRKYFTTSRGLPQGAFRRYMQRKGHIESAQDRAAKRLIDLRQIVAEEYVTPESQAAVMAKLNTLLGIPQSVVDGTHYNVSGPHPLTRGMSPRLLATLRGMRDSIDEMSATLKDNLDLPDGLRAKIKDNMGLYVNRSYKLFSEPDWAKNVPAEVKDKFIELATKEYEKMFADQIASGRLDPDKIPTMAAALANSVLMRGAESQSPIAMLSIIEESDLKGASILMKRRIGDDDFSKALRALMGEEDNIFKNYTNTITKMAAVIENHRLFADIRGMGIEQGWIVHGDMIPSGEGDQWVAIHSPDKFKPDYMLHGLYVKHEVREALEFLLQPKKTDVGGLMGFIFKANALTKYGKTVLSPLTHSRNFIGNIPHMIANGYFNGNAMDTNLREWWSTAAAGNDLFGVTDEKRRERYRRMVELGVVNYGFEVEIEDMIRQSGADETLGSFLTRVGRISRDTSSLTQKVIGKTQQMYSFEDDVFKVIAFEIEAGRLKKAYPLMKDDEIEAMAAEIVGQTMPNYEMVPEAVLALRRLPIVGTFPSHTAEMIRTTIGRIRLARSEMSDSNPEIQKAGRNRMMGLAIMLSLPSIAAIAFKSLSGISDEEEEAIRRMLPFWNRNSTLLFQRGENGEIKFTDYGYVDPFVYFRKPIIALFAGRHSDVDKAILESLEQIFQPFIGQEVFFGAAYEAVRNKDMNGRAIVEPGTSTFDQAGQLLTHVLSGIEPGFIGQGIDFVRAATGQVNDYGRRYSLANSILTHATGFKTETISPMQSFLFKLAEFNRLDRELGSRYRASIRTAKGVDEDYLIEAVGHYNGARQNLQKDLLSLVGGMRALGYSDRQIRQGMSFGAVSRDLTESLLEGEFRNYDVPTTALESAVERFQFTNREVPFGEPGELEERIRILMEATEDLNRPDFRQVSEGRASLRK